MSDQKHTPGPWYACGDEVLIDMGDRAHLVATAADWSEETEPNARLIAAAPALLEALQEAEPLLAEMLKYLEANLPNGARMPVLEKVRAALASAQGNGKD